MSVLFTNAFCIFFLISAGIVVILPGLVFLRDQKEEGNRRGWKKLAVSLYTALID